MYEFLPLVFAVVGAAVVAPASAIPASLLAILAVCALVFAYFTLHASLLGMVPVLVVLGVVLFLLQAGPLHVIPRLLGRRIPHRIHDRRREDAPAPHLLSLFP